MSFLEEQQNCINYFFENFDKKIIDDIVELLIEKNNNRKSIYWTGVGKSFNIASHSSDMLKSMGFSSHILKPIEGLHGDIGMIRDEDVIFILSKSGNTRELNNIILHLNKLNVYIIGVFCNKNAKLSKYCNKTIILPCGKELDNGFDLVPTTSIVIFTLFINFIISKFIEVKKLTIEQYGINHPSGTIGKKVWLNVSDIMYRLEDICIVKDNNTVIDSMVNMTEKKSGYAIVVHNEEFELMDKTIFQKYQLSKVIGFVSDGDIRRFILENKGKPNYLDTSILDIISRNPTTIYGDVKIRDVVKQINKKEYLGVGLPVVDENEDLIGFIDNKLLIKYADLL